METLSYKGNYGQNKPRSAKREGVRSERNYSAFRKMSLRLTFGQRIEPVCAGNGIAALDAPAEPVKKLFFLSFDNHRTTSNTVRMNDRMMRSGIPGIP